MFQNPSALGAFSINPESTEIAFPAFNEEFCGLLRFIVYKTPQPAGSGIIPIPALDTKFIEGTAASRCPAAAYSGRSVKLGELTLYLEGQDLWVMKQNQLIDRL